jgi:uncharacterized phage infection (PIP) family protein YhgE
MELPLGVIWQHPLEQTLCHRHHRVDPRFSSPVFASLSIMSEVTEDNLLPSSAKKPGDSPYTALEKGADALLALIEDEKTKAIAESSSRISELENHCSMLKSNFSKLESVAKTVNTALGKAMARCRELTEDSQRANKDLAATREELSTLQDKLNAKSDTEKEMNEDLIGFRAMLHSRMGITWDGSIVTLRDSWKQHDLDAIKTCFSFFIRRIECSKGTQDGCYPFPTSPRLHSDTGQLTSEVPHDRVEESMNVENHSQQQQIQELSQAVPSANLVETSIGHDVTSEDANVSNELHVPDQVAEKNDKTDEIAYPTKDSAPSSESSSSSQVYDREVSSR